MVPWEKKLWVYSSPPLERGCPPVICVLPLFLLEWAEGVWRLGIKDQVPLQFLNCLPGLVCMPSFSCFCLFVLALPVSMAIGCYFFLLKFVPVYLVCLIAVHLFCILLAFPRISTKSCSISLPDDNLFGQNAYGKWNKTKLFF